MLCRVMVSEFPENSWPWNPFVLCLFSLLVCTPTFVGNIPLLFFIITIYVSKVFKYFNNKSVLSSQKSELYLFTVLRTYFLPIFVFESTLWWRKTYIISLPLISTSNQLNILMESHQIDHLFMQHAYLK